MNKGITKWQWFKHDLNWFFNWKLPSYFRNKKRALLFIYRNYKYKLVKKIVKKYGGQVVNEVRDDYIRFLAKSKNRNNRCEVCWYADTINEGTNLQ